MTSSALSILPRLLLATGWTCEASITGSTRREIWRHGVLWERAWTAEACGKDPAALQARLDDLIWIARTVVSSSPLELGERLGLLRAADELLDESEGLVKQIGETRFTMDDPRGKALLNRMAEHLIGLADIDSKAWLATRKAAT